MFIFIFVCHLRRQTKIIFSELLLLFFFCSAVHCLLVITILRHTSAVLFLCYVYTLYIRTPQQKYIVFTSISWFSFQLHPHCH